MSQKHKNSQLKSTHLSQTYKLWIIEVASESHGHLSAGFIAGVIRIANVTFVIINILLDDEIWGWRGNVWICFCDRCLSWFILHRCRGSTVPHYYRLWQFIWRKDLITVYALIEEQNHIYMCVRHNCRHKPFFRVLSRGTRPSPIILGPAP